MLLSKDKTKRLPYQFYFIPTLLLTLLGILNSTYLAYTHYKNYTDIEFASFCALSKSVNCDTVAQSTWSIFLGIPVAYWGLLGYLIFLILLLPTRSNNKSTQSLWSFLFLLAILFCFTALSLAYISTAYIKSYCILCIFSYILSFSLLIYTWVIRRRFDHGSLLGNLIKSFKLISTSKFIKALLLLLLILLIGTKIILPTYWHLPFPKLDNSITTGTTPEGHPWIGAIDPELIIEEFSDYQCFQCYKMHYTIRRLIAEHPDKIRLVHKHYPLDHEFNPIIVQEPFHIGSGRLSLLSIAASQQNKFWQANDYLFQEIRKGQERFNFEVVASHLDLDFAELKRDYTSPNSLKLIEEDIREGLQHNITSTPTFVVNGEIYEGYIPTQILQKFSDQ